MPSQRRDLALQDANHTINFRDNKRSLSMKNSRDVMHQAIILYDRTLSISLKDNRMEVSL